MFTLSCIYFSHILGTVFITQDMASYTLFVLNTWVVEKPKIAWQTSGGLRVIMCKCRGRGRSVKRHVLLSPQDQFNNHRSLVTRITQLFPGTAILMHTQAIYPLFTFYAFLCTLFFYLAEYVHSFSCRRRLVIGNMVLQVQIIANENSTRPHTRYQSWQKKRKSKQETK